MPTHTAQYLQGYVAAVDGKTPKDNPYNKGDEALSHIEWSSGFADGCYDMLMAN